MYCLYNKPLSGLLNITITGVYLRDDSQQSDTIKLWCRVENSHLLSNMLNISDNVWARENEQYDEENELLM
jgi:hypothetical protein